MRKSRPEQLRLLLDDEAANNRASPTLVAGAFDPARLTQARQLAGWTKKELAEAVGVTPAAIGQYETGSIRVRPALVPRLAAAVEVPIEFFLVGRPHGKLDASMAHFRSLRSTRTYQRAKAISFVEQVWELTYALEKRVQLPVVDLPGFSGGEVTSGVALPQEPIEAARELRRHWKLGTGPIPHLVRQLESKGVVTVIAPSDSDSAKVDAFSTSRLPRPLIVLTVYRANDVYRHRFTAGHELGHLVLHGDVASGDPQQEREADAFAAEFLTPRESIARELPLRVDFSKLVRLQKTWGVSVKSLLRRCRELGLISESSATRAYQRLNLLDGQPGFSREPISGFVGEQPALLSRAFELAAEAGLTETSLARELAWTPYRIREILGTVEKRPDLRLIVGSGLSEDADIYVDAGARLSHRDRRRSSSPGILASVDPLESEDGPLLTRPGVAQRSVEGPFRPSDL